MKKLVIAGIDPGTNSAYALIDIDGNLIEVFSKRNSSVNEFISMISKDHKVFLLGTDRASVPLKIKKISQSIGAKVISPDHDLNYLEKIRIVDEFLKHQNRFVKLSNKHEKDAVASALYSYKRIRNLLKKIDDHLRENNLLHIEEEVKIKVLLEDKPIVTAIKEIS